jgi:hypothetical protein
LPPPRTSAPASLTSQPESRSYNRSTPRIDSGKWRTASVSGQGGCVVAHGRCVLPPPAPTHPGSQKTMRTPGFHLVLD